MHKKDNPGEEEEAFDQLHAASVKETSQTQSSRASSLSTGEESFQSSCENTFSMLASYYCLPSRHGSQERCICSTGHGCDLAQHNAESSKMGVANAHSLAVEIAPYGTYGVVSDVSRSLKDGVWSQGDDIALTLQLRGALP